MGTRPLVEHTACIDLPGEPVKCWADTDVTVLLRKHRDLILDINLKAGAAYTLTASDDWFYDVVQKKRVQHGQFQDGQRYHVWISRSFKGRLTLKQNGKELHHFSMRSLGLTNTDPDPKHKPAPIIIALGHRPDQKPAPTPAPAAPATGPRIPYMLAAPPPAGQNISGFDFATSNRNSQQLWVSPLPLKLAPNTKIMPTQDAHVVEVKHTNIPQEVLNALAAGGGDDTAIDTNDIATRNWLLSQLVGTLAYLKDNQEWIRELWGQKFRLLRIVHRRVGERMYVVFSGNPRLRQYMSAAKYGAENPKVLTIGGGAGTVESASAAVWENSKGAFKEAGLLAIVFTVVLDTAEWLHDYQQIGPDGKRKKDFADLLAKIGMDLLKAGVSAAAATAIVAMVVTGIAGTVALPVAAIVVGTILVAVAIGYGLDWVDKHTHATDHVASWFRSIGASLKSAAEYLADSMPKDYNGYPMMYPGL